jgi:hypothetical protein
MGQDRQSVLARQRRDAFEQLGRAPLGRRRGERPGLKFGRGLSQPPNLTGHKVEFIAGAAVLPGEAFSDRIRKILWNERCDVERSAIPRGDREPVRSRMAPANSRMACWPFVTE